MKTNFVAIHERIKDSIHHAISDEAEDWSIMPSDIANEIDNGFLAYAEGLEEQCAILQTEQTAFMQTQTEVLNSHVMNEHLHLTSFQTEAIDKVPQKLDRTDFEAHLQDDARHLTFSDKDTLSQVAQKLDREEFEKHAGNYSAHLSHWQSEQIEDSFNFRNMVASVSEATEAGTYLVQSTAEDLPEDLAETATNEYTLRVYEYTHSDELSKFERSISQFLDVFGKNGYTCYVRQGFLEKTEPETPALEETAENPEILPEVEETQNPYWFSPWQVQSSASTETPTPTKPQASVFLCEDTSNGTAINSAEYSYYPCYVGAGQVVYSNNADSGKLYLKNINDTSNGTVINSVSSNTPCYVGGGQIVYSNSSDGGKLYLKNSNDNSNGTAINSVNSYYPCYVGNGQVVYRNVSDSYKLYLKSINDTSNGTVINSTVIYFPCYVGNGQIVYSNNADGGKLYLKNINDTSNGTPINSVNSSYPCYVGGGQIVYRDNNNGWKLYLKNINDTSNGTAINSAISEFPCYIGGGQVVYSNNDDVGKLYLKNINEYI